MSSQMVEAIRQLTQDKGISEDAVLRTIENMLKAAYKRKFGTCDNAIVQFSDDLSDVSVYSRRVIVDGYEIKAKDFNPALHIELEDALELSPECEVGDEIDILIDPKELNFSAIQTGKQSAHQSLSEIQKDSLYSEFKDKVGEIIIGYYQRERNGTIYVDLGKVEGILPAKNQSPREVYHKNDRIKALVTDIKKTNSGLQLVLSRRYRTKIAVYSRREDIDPVGACVGLKGVRIQSVIRELEGEKIDILKYDADPCEFIKNALSPAEVTGVVILDEEKRQALAVVSESQFSLAIGKQGLNVRLADRLVDWNIDVKTEDQYEELDELVAASRKAAQELFADEPQTISELADIPGIDGHVVAVLKENGINDIEQFLLAVEDGSIARVAGLEPDDITGVEKLINDTVEFVEDEPDGTSESDVPESVEDGEDEYVCPECGAKITIDMTECPNCGIGLSFEEEDEE